ncbi:hypothetical protein GGI08_006948 [Coemansia sp. S2]|nr:hypothetical protein GGI08_006948 [Coemansia sp. S2]
MLIVYKTVEYLECRSKYSIGLDMDKHNKSKAVLTPLLSVSECWRRAALESICDNCALDFDHSHEARKIFFPVWPAVYKLAQLRETNMAKVVVFSATFGRTVIDKATNEATAWLQRRGVVAPNAKTMLLCLRKADNQAASSDNNPTGQQSAIEFARYLLQMAPLVTGIVVSIPSIDAARSEFLQMYDSLISTLCQGGIKLLHAYSVRGTIPISLNLLGVSGLTSITNGVNIACAPFARLIYLNARTLKTIDFRVAAENNWRNMIFGFTETPAVYTRLTTLTLMVIGIPYESTWAAIDDVVPFPVLLTLHVGDMYPFDDDLLFRGNGRTMRNLRLPFRAIARNILARFNILKRSGVSRMSSVRIGNVYGMDVTFMAERADVILKQQVHHILETATKLKITRETSHMGIFNAIKLAPSTTILQHLDYGVFTRFCVATLRNLIAFLPSLVSLTCTLADRGLADRVTSESKYPSSLRSKNYPLSKNFRVLRVHHTTGASASTIAKISMLVAIACPNFSHVDMPSELRNPFSREIAWATCNRPFEPYADSIRRLIF